jgi:hypothetical protein
MKIKIRKFSNEVQLELEVYLKDYLIYNNMSLVVKLVIKNLNFQVHII